MLNSVSARPKSSKVERIMNKELMIVFVLQVRFLIKSEKANDLLRVSGAC